MTCFIHGCMNEAARDSFFCGQCLSRMDPRYVPSFEETVRSDGNSIFTRPRARV